MRNKRVRVLMALLVGAVLCFVAFFGASVGKQRFFYPLAPQMPADVQESTGDVLTKLESALEKFAPQTLATLQPGLAREEIIEREEQLGVTLSDEMRALYMWRNGQSADAGKDFVPGHFFPSLEWLIEERKASKKQLGELSAVQRASYSAFAGHRDKWVGVFGDLAGDGYFFDPTRTASEGAVFYNMAEDISYNFFPSLKSLLSYFIECYESKAYFVGADGKLEEDFNKSFELLPKYSSSNWEQ